MVFLYGTYTDISAIPSLLLQTGQFISVPLQFLLDKRVSVDSIYDYTKTPNLT